jgi:spermidine dehydrogenase
MSDDQRDDEALGVNDTHSITRRDFLNSTLLASGAALLAGASPLELAAAAQPTAATFDGYGGVGDYSNSNGNTFQVVADGHAIRDEVYAKLPPNIIDTQETYDCVVVGGGISGLSAALLLARKAPKATCLVLDNHPIFGGEAKRNEFIVDGHRLIAHQGSAAWWAPTPGTFTADFYDLIGVDWRQFQYQKWSGRDRELHLGRTPYDESSDYGFYFGAGFGAKPGVWVIDPWGKKLAGAPLSAEDRAELLKMTAGKPAPKPKYHGDPISRQLDSITLEDHMIERYGISRAAIRKYLTPVAGGGSGLGPDALSAYADYAADVLCQPLQVENGEQMFPGGNTGIARHVVKAVIPNAIPSDRSLRAICRSKVNFAALDRAGQRVRIRLRSTVVAAKHDGAPEHADTVDVVYTQGGRLYRVKARSVIIAGGSWTARHIVRDLPESHRDAYAQFHRSPCLMANVAVRNWRFMYKLGMTGCRWFEGIGNYMAVRTQPTFGADSTTISPDSPTVLTLKILFAYPGEPIDDQGTRGRRELFSTSFREYERQIRRQFIEMFARSGFDARRDIAGIILNRWGHAYLNPQPGFFFGKNGDPAPSDVLRAKTFGRIAFANTDLSGIMDHRTSIMEANRAVGQVVPLLA